MVRTGLRWGLHLLPLCAVAQVCDTGKPEPVTNVSLRSRAGTATLVGFAEYNNPATPPKKYRRQVTAGTMHLGQWSVAGCPDASEPVGYQAAFPPSEIFWANSTGSVALEPVAIDAATNQVKYRLTGLSFANHTTATPWGDLWALRVAATPADGSQSVIFSYVGQEFWLSRTAARNPYNFIVHGYWNLAGWVGHVETQRFVNVRSAVDKSIRDEWDEIIDYPRQGGDPVTTTQNQRHVGIGTFPLTSGGTPETWPGMAATAAYGDLAAVTPLSATEQRIAGKAECMGAAPLFQRAEGAVTQTLNEEDTEEDALARAAVTAGMGNVAFRERRTTGFSFAFSGFTFEVPLQIQCEGDYLVHFHFQRQARNGTAEPEKFSLTLEKKLPSGHQTLPPGRFDIATMQLHLPEGGTMPLEYDTDYTLLGVELERSCPGSEAGRDQIWHDSVHVHLSLGLGEAGRSAGQLMLDAEAITPALYAPSALAVATPYGSGTAVVRDANNRLRQVKAPAALADIVVLDANAYEVRFYAPDAIGVPDPGTGIFALNGSPYVVCKFENPDPATATRLRVSRVRGTQVRVSEFASDADTGSWTFSTGNGLRRESIAVEDLGDTRLETTTVTGADDEPVAKVWREIRVFPWGEETILEINDPDGAALTTASTYFANAGEPGYGRLQRRDFPDGSFEEHTYDALGRPLTTVRPYSGAANGNQVRQTTFAYEAISDADGDSLVEALTTTSVFIGDDEISRSHVIRWSRPIMLAGEEFLRRSDMRCATPGAAWSATDNLATETLTYGPGPFNGQVRRRHNPDGTVELTQYTLDASGRQTTVTLSGAPNATLDDVLDGTRTVTMTSGRGRTLSETVSDVASGRMLSAWQATEFDLIGRPTRIDYDDGTQVLREYACCGIATERDRTGRVTSYQYDDLGRQYEVVRDGIKTHSAFDAEGRVISVTRIGSDNSEVRLSTNLYDLAGRLVEERDAMDRPTSHDEEVQPYPGVAFVRTTTAPDGGTRIETYLQDGSLANITGTAVAPRSFQYGVDADGVYSLEIKGEATGEPGPMPGPATPPAASEWTKTSTDFLGRIWKTTLADGATAFSHFNPRGQLVRTVDPDGFATLYGYNSRGEQDTVALDLNADGLINFDGTDRITRTVTEVGERDGKVVRRVSTLVWETEGQDTPTTVAVSEQTPDGLRAWQSDHGLTTSVVTTHEGDGRRTVTTTAPDQVQTVQVFAGDRLTSTLVQAPALGVLSSATLAYDAHGRLESATDDRNGSTIYTYFADDQVHTVTTPDPDPARTGVGYDPQLTTYAYDECGRVATVIQPDGGEVHTTYWPTGLVRRTWGARTYPVEYTYDAQGRLQTLTTWQDFAGDTGRAVTTWNYHPLRGWLSGKRYADGTGPDYAYYPSGRLRTRTWARTPAVTTDYRYNPAGELTGIDYSDATPDVTTTFNRAGQAVAVTDGAGQRTMTYHASGRLENESYTAGFLASMAVHRSYDALSRLTNLAVLGSQSTVLGSADYAHDPASRLATVTAGGNTATYGYVPNAPLVETITFKQSGATRLTSTRSYDNLNRLSALNNAPASALSAAGFAYTYNSANQRIRNGRENGAYWTYGYDALGQVSVAGKKLPGGEDVPAHSFAYTYDDIGNRRSASRNAASAALMATEEYSANLLNQYVQRTVPGCIEVLGAAQPDATVTVMIPPANGTVHSTLRQGDLYHLQLPVDNAHSGKFESLTVSGVANLIGPAGEDAVTEETRSVFIPASPETFVHDLDGNLTADAHWAYAWDAENRLIAMETAAAALAVGVPGVKLEFAYDAQSRRIAKKVSNWIAGVWVLASHHVFLYDGWHMIAELDALNGNAPVRTHVWGLDVSGTLAGAGGVGGLLFTNSHLPTPNSHAAAYDGNGNIAALIDMSTGTAAATYEYSPFGETLIADGPAAAANPFRFSTKYTDPETNLLYYGYRYLSPSTGRWLNRDPIEEQGGVNVYGMVSNDPVIKFDLHGLWSPETHDYLARIMPSH
ncbi:MAG: RHS repeat-associated core domain-containing protein [Opitutaceae bacterium]|nr:RHS repeat-associated core domain-containing protein [Opitutaceae bacterium]